MTDNQRPKMAHTLFGLLTLSVMVTRFAEGSKILLIPPDHYSNTHFFAVAGGALAEAGHVVHFLTVPRHRNLVEKHGMTGIYFQAPNYTNALESDEFMDTIVKPAEWWKLYKLKRKILASIDDFCHGVLGDKELNDQISTVGFDLALVESVNPVRCLMVIPYRNGIPHVSMGTRHDPWVARVPASPSAEGHYGLYPFADPYDPTMWERFRAFLLEVAIYLVLPWTMDNEYITKYAPARPAISMRELHQAAELTFVNMEIYCLETPRVSAPNYVYLGGIGTEPARPLVGEFEEFVKGAEDGLVVVTFGSLIKKIPMSRMEEFISVFKQIPQRVVMRYEGRLPPEVPDNVLLSKWIPQNDLLGHPRTRLFITHAGGNSHQEALYHGVPFVSMPIFADQTYNALRGVARGFGTVLSFTQTSPEDLLNSINHVLNDPAYKERIKTCSLTYKSLPSPQKTLTFWVEHVIKHGGDHLKPPALKLPLWRWFSLDILFICFILIHFNLHIAKFAFKGVRVIFRKCYEKA